MPPITPYDPMEVILLSRKKISATPVGHARFTVPVDVTRVMASPAPPTTDQNARAKTPRVVFVEPSKDEPSYFEGTYKRDVQDEMTAIKDLYNALTQTGIANHQPNYPKLAYSDAETHTTEGVSGWKQYGSRIQELVGLSRKSHRKREKQAHVRESRKDPMTRLDAFQNRAFAGKEYNNDRPLSSASTEELQAEPAPKSKPGDSNDVVYAWDPMNQTFSTRRKLEKLNSNGSMPLSSIPIRQVSLLSSQSLSKVRVFLFIHL